MNMAKTKKQSRLQRVKHHAFRVGKVALKIWCAVVITLLSLILIPLFLKGVQTGTFYNYVIIPSIIVYFILTYIQLKLKPGLIKGYLEGTANRLFWGIVTLAATYILSGLYLHTLAAAMAVAAAVCYAFFLQRISFLRLIGL